MRKFLSAMLILSMITALVACGNTDNKTTGQSDSTSAKSDMSSEPSVAESSDNEKQQGFEVDEGLFSVTITVPADFVGETTQEELEKEAKENGYKSATLNEDGSLTYVMTKKQHDEMMQEIRNTIYESLDGMAGSEDYPSIVSVEVNDDFSQYKVVTTNTEISFEEAFSVFGFYMYSGLYYAFDGGELDNVNVQFVNEASGEVIDEANSSDME